MQPHKTQVRSRLTDLDEDLAAFQAKAATPAARVIGTSKKPKSKFAQQRQAQQQHQRFVVDEEQLDPKPSARPVGLVGDILEREPDASTAHAPKPGVFPQSDGFPLAPTFRAKQHPEYAAEPTSVQSPPTFGRSPPLETNEQDDIGAESDAMLSAMTEEEILRAQDELRQMLSPSTLNFLMKQKPRRGHSSEESNPPKLAAPPPAELPVASTSKAPPAATPSAKHSASTSSLCFDLQGRITSRHSTHAHLSHEHHSHNADEFTLASLLILTRSSVNQQRVSGLAVAARVVQVNANAIHLGSFAESLLPTLCQTLSRSTHVGLLSASLQCLDAVLQLPKLVDVALEQKPSLLDSIASLFGPDSPIEETRMTGVEALKCLLTCLEQGSNAGTAIAEHPTLLSSLCVFSLQTPWPCATRSDAPLSLTLLVLRTLAALSRSFAERVVQLPAIDLSLRFLALPFWTIQDAAVRSAGREVVLELLELLACLGRYGLALEVRGKIWMTRFEMARAEQRDAVLDDAWFGLVAIWLVGAMDPHATSPPHSLLWTQVEVFRNDLEEALVNVGHLARHQRLSHLLDSVFIWNSAVSALRKSADAVPVNVGQLAQQLDFADADERYLFSWLRIATFKDATLNVPGRLADELARRLVATNGASSVHALARLVPYVQPRFAYYAAIMAHLDCDSVELTADVLSPAVRAFFPQNPELATRILDVLQPLLPTQSLVVPFVTTPESLQHVQRVRPTAVDKTLWSRCWALKVPLDQLHHMAHATVWRRLPLEWNFTEVDILKAALSLQLAACTSLTGHDFAEACLPTQHDVLFQLMRLYLLSSNSDRPTLMAEDDTLYFRHPDVARLVQNTLDFLPQLSPVISDATDPAFYALFADLLQLYDAVSLGDATFGALVLAIALDTRLPVDFRRCLFIDHPDALRSISADYPPHLAALAVPAQTDPSIASSVASAVHSASIQAQRNPGLYKFASAHIPVQG